jgi:hypothetical protein
MSCLPAGSQRRMDSVPPFQKGPSVSSWLLAVFCCLCPAYADPGLGCLSASPTVSELPSFPDPGALVTVDDDLDDEDELIEDSLSPSKKATRPGWVWECLVTDRCLPWRNTTLHMDPSLRVFTLLNLRI